MLAAALGLASRVQAQTDATSGTIEGVVSDATGGVLPGAAVRFTNAATGWDNRWQAPAAAGPDKGKP